MNLLSFFKIALLSVFVLSLFGCATSAHHTNMTVNANELPVEAKKNTALTNNIAVEDVSGGKKTNPLWTSQVDNSGFENALKNSLSNTGYLNSDTTKARYYLAATLLDLKQPFIGASLEVICKANYSLYDTKIGKTVFEKTLRTSYVASFTSSLIGTTRLRLANEGAVKENIKQFLVELDSL